MGEVNQERQTRSQDHMLRGVPEATWRKVKLMSAAFDLPISAIVSEAIELLADSKAEEIGRRLKT